MSKDEKKMYSKENSTKNQNSEFSNLLNRFFMGVILLIVFF